MNDRNDRPSAPAARPRLFARMPRRRRDAQRGQALVLFVLIAVALIGAVAIVTDVSWLWYGQNRMQRAADAAALAGAIYLPGNPTLAYSTARAEAVKNGFTDGSGGVAVTPTQDPANRRRLIVRISGPVNTFFARVFGMSSVNESVISRAEFVLPVPMGSPQNYYGVGYLIDSTVTTTATPVSSNSNWRTSAGITGTGSSWTNPNNANGTQDTSYAVSPAISATATQRTQQWGTGFGLTSGSPSPIPAPGTGQTLSIDGIELELRGLLTGSGTASAYTNCHLDASLSWDSGTTWSNAQTISSLTTSIQTFPALGSSSSTSAWGSHAWTRSDFTNLRVRLIWNAVSGSGPSCPTTRTVSVDTLRVRVSYTTTTTTTTITTAPRSVTDPISGSVLPPQNFWGAMQSEGVVNSQGDAYLTKYETRSSSGGASGVNLNASYDYVNYYNYGVDIPAGAVNGQVWIFDPGFCDVTTSGGTGEYWTGDNSTNLPASAFYDLYNTMGTPYDITDDALVTASGDAWRRFNEVDSTLHTQPYTVPSGVTDCHGLSWHHDWWQLASGLSGGTKGTTYRLHTYSTDPNNLTDQQNTTALNAFAIYSTASGGTPRVYGIGAMEAYARLPGGSASEFYLAQVDAIHAGKTLVIDLWDPGDTGSLPATLTILKPTTSSYVPATISWQSAKGTSNTGASSCDGQSGTNVTSITTNSGTTKYFNGCWVTITIPLPTDYTAPHPSSDSTTSEGGWWKIRYTMGGSSSSFSTDLTTWKVAIRGNPVHLVVP